MEHYEIFVYFLKKINLIKILHPIIGKIFIDVYLFIIRENKW